MYYVLSIKYYVLRFKYYVLHITYLRIMYYVLCSCKCMIVCC